MTKVAVVQANSYDTQIVEQAMRPLRRHVPIYTAWRSSIGEAEHA